MDYQLFETDFLKGSHGEWARGLNAQAPSIYLPNSQLFKLIGGWGHMDFLNIPDEAFSLYNNKYKIQRGVQTLTRIGQPLFEISYIVKGGGIIDLNNHGDMVLKARQFNITYAPYTQCKTTLRPRLNGESLDIYLTYEQLSVYYETFPEIIGPFLEAAQQQKFCNFKSAPLYLPGKLFDQVLRISQLINQPRASIRVLPTIFKVNVQALIMDTFRYLNGSKSKGLSSLQENRMRFLKSEIFEFIGTDALNVAHLASFIDIPIPELKGLLSEWYNKVPRAFIFELRMTAARKLIQENTSLQEVSIKVGYKSPEIFAQQFKYIYGIAPSDYKRDWKKRAHCDQRFGSVKGIHITKDK